MRVPRIKDRRLFDVSRSGGKMESDQAFVYNNIEACVWFLENRDEIAKNIRIANAFKIKPKV